MISPGEIHTAACGPCHVWVVCVRACSGELRQVAHGVADEEFDARWGARIWVYEAVAKFYLEAEKLLCWHSNVESVAHKQRRRNWRPVFAGVPVIAVEQPEFDRIKTWCEDMRALCTTNK